MRVSSNTNARTGISVIKTAGIICLGALVLIGALWGGVKLLTYEPVGILATDGIALSDAQVSKNLQDALSTGEVGGNLTATTVNAGDRLYTRFDGNFVGDSYSSIALEYPLFITGGAAVEDMQGSALLITDNFEEVESYKGMILSDGVVYDSAGISSDTQSYRFLKLADKIFVNTKPLAFSGGVEEATVPANSLVCFGEKTLAYYTLEEGVFVCHTVATSAPTTFVSFERTDDTPLSYVDLMNRLGLTAETPLPVEMLSDNEAGDEENQAEEDKANEEANQTSKDSAAEAATTTEPSPSEVRPAEWKWIKPTATSNPLVATVYRISGSFSFNDPAGVVTKPIRYEFRHNDALFMRSSFASSGAFVVDGFAPFTTYHVQAYLTYENEAGETIEENFFTQTLTTAAINSLDPMSFTFSQGAVTYNKITLDGILFTGGSEEMLANAKRVAFVIGGKEYALSSEQQNTLAKKEKVSYTTPPSITSNHTYEVSMVSYDRFGSKQTITPFSLTVRTSKAPPSARINLAGNDVTSAHIKVELDDPDGVSQGNARIALFDEMGRQFDSQALTGGKTLFTFEGLNPDQSFVVKVFADYDLGEGEGIRINEEIGAMTFTTVSVTTLGYAVFTTQTSDLTDTDTTINLGIATAQMNSRLLALLTYASLEVKNDQGKTVYSHTVSEEEMKDLKAGNTLPLKVKSLTSMTNYTVSVQSGAQVGDASLGGQYYDIRTTNRPVGFKTLRKTPFPEFINTIVTKDLIGFDVHVVDKNGAIGGRAMVEIRDKFGRLAAEQQYFDVSLSSDDPYLSFLFESLSPDVAYTVNIIAYDYNPGYTDASFESRHVLYTAKIVTKEGVSGKIELRGVDAVEGNNTKLSVRLRTTLEDRYEELSPKNFVIKVYRDDAFVDSFVSSFGGRGETSDLAGHLIDRGYYGYRFELSVTLHGKNLVLGSISFSGERPIIGISNDAELQAIASDMDASYIALNDITSRAYYIGGAGKAFNGSLDFQGYTLDQSEMSYALFYTVSPSATIKNIVFKKQIGGGASGAVAYSNKGTISNIQVAAIAPRTSTIFSNYGGVAYSNSGTIENFVVTISSSVSVASYVGGACYYNELSGVVRNGYVTGEGGFSVPEGVPSDVSLAYLGGLIGRNEGLLENAFTTLSITVPNDRAYVNCGLAVGTGSGQGISNILATGTLSKYYENESNNAESGPVVGPVTSLALVSNVFYYPENQVCNNTYNASVSIHALYDRQWYNDTICSSGAFNLIPVLGEYYPQVVFPSCMPAQTAISLPYRGPTTIPAVSAVTLLEQQDDSATVQISFYNPSHYAIHSVNVAYLDCVVLSQKEDEENVSRVNVMLSKPSYFYSSYSLTSFTYELYPGKYIPVNYSQGTTMVPVEFFRAVSDPTSWKAIDLSPYENYRLTKTIDFSGEAEGLICLQGSFYGKLDGNGKSLRNVNISTSLIPNLYGKVVNLSLDTMTISGVGTYIGAVGYMQKGSQLDGVCLKNSKVSGVFYVGGLVGFAETATIKNSSVIDTSVTATYFYGRTGYVGGMVGRMNGSTLSHCFVQEIKVVTDSAYTTVGVGGMVGYMASKSSLSACYAVGSLTVAAPCAGGIVGYADIVSGGTVSEVWSWVSITSTSDEVGGLVGSMFIPSACPAVRGLALGDIYNSARDSSAVHATLGKGTLPPGMFHYENQQIIGGTPDGSTALTQKDLTQVRTYQGVIGFSSYEYTGVEKGILPKLLSTQGTVLPNQRDTIIEGNAVSITHLEAALTSEGYTVQVTIQHPKMYSITSLSFDWLSASKDPSKEVSAGKDQTIIKYEHLTPQRAYDSYSLNRITYADDVGMKHSLGVMKKIDFGSPVYKQIWSLQDWKNIPFSTYENYMLMKDIDFSPEGKKETVLSLGNCGVGLGRLEGVTQEGGAKPVFKNLDLVFKDNPKSFIGKIRTSLTNVAFENITLANTEAAISNNLGIVDIVYGGDNAGVRDVDFKNVTINSVPNKNRTANPSFAAPIISVQGSVRNVSLASIRVTAERDETASGSMCYGGLCADTTQSAFFDTISATDVKVAVKGGGYVASLVGRLYGSMTHLSLTQSTASATKAYTGGIAGYAFGDASIQGVTLSEVQVFGSTYVGGVAGFSASYVKEVEAHDLVVRGTSQVGGLAGRACVLDSTLADSVVYGSGSMVGGLAAETIAVNQSDGSRLVTSGVSVTRVSVTGGDSVGGAVGRLLYSISSVFVIDSTVTGTASNVGGVIGYGQSGFLVSYCGNTNTVVTGVSSVGGLVGYSTGAIRTCFVAPHEGGDPVSVSGSGNDVGGLAGTQTGRSQSFYCYTNVAVHAGGSNAGGLFGSLPSQYSTSLANTSIMNAYWTGTVSGTENVGGFMGYSNAGATKDFWGLLGFGSVSSSTAQHLTLGVGFNPQTGNANTFDYVRIWNGSKINGTSISSGASAQVALGAGARSYALATPTDMRTETYYTRARTATSPGLNFSKASWNFEDLANGRAPQLTWYSYDGNTTLPAISLPYQEKVALPVAARSFQLFSAPSSEDASEVDDLLSSLVFYASDADSINIEFTSVALGADADTLKFSLSSQEGEVLSGVVRNPVYTFRYDFKTPLTLTVSYKGQVREFSLDPSTLKRSVMAWNGGGYSLAADGLYRLSDKIQEGDFVNIYKGKALRADGTLVDVESGASVGYFSGVLESLAEVRPLLETNASTGTCETFWGFSVVGGEEGVVRPYRMYAKGGKVYVLEGSLDIVPDAVVFDESRDSAYQTVLTSKGSLEDMATPLVYPEDFSNENIVYASSDLVTDSSLLMVQYASGRVVAFDYTTGENLLSTYLNGAPSLFDFAATFFAERFGVTGSMPSASSDQYGSALTFERELRSGRFAGKEVERGGNSSNSAEEEGSSSSGSPEGSATSGISSDSGSSSSGVTGSSPHATGGFGNESGYMSVWDSDASAWQTYAISDMFDASQEEPLSQNDRYDYHPEYAGDKSAQSTKNNALALNKQIALYGAIVVVILGLLIVIVRRRRSLLSQSEAQSEA